jgi:hypothetical protein
VYDAVLRVFVFMCEWVGVDGTECYAASTRGGGGGMSLVDMVNESMDALSRHTSTGCMMRMAMTCRTLYERILGHLRQSVHKCVRRPFQKQEIYLMMCPHCYVDKQTAFVVTSSDLWRSVATVRCTYCLYGFKTRLRSLPSSTWWTVPSHGVQVEEIVHKAGTRHTLLAPRLERS